MRLNNNLVDILTQTKEDVELSFRADLKALLAKYNADIEASDHYSGYPECGEDIKMIVNIPSLYDGNEQIREYTEIDLGHWVDGKG